MQFSKSAKMEMMGSQIPKRAKSSRENKEVILFRGLHQSECGTERRMRLLQTALLGFPCACNSPRVSGQGRSCIWVWAEAGDSELLTSAQERVSCRRSTGCTMGSQGLQEMRCLEEEAGNAQGEGGGGGDGADTTRGMDCSGASVLGWLK